MILYYEINLLKAYVDAWIGIANGCARCEGYQRWTHARQYQITVNPAWSPLE